MITKLEIQNWRTHKDSTLEFDNGTNVIVGVMGSGKSSIVNALCYSLFGTFPALKNKSVSLKEIVMNKPNQCEEARTNVEFNFENDKYRVERVIKIDSTNEAKLFQNGKLVAGPKQKDVNEKVEDIFGLSYELFSRAIYAEQNEMDFFLKLTPSERKKKFDELLELEKYETARKNALTLKNQFVKENKQRNDYITQQKNNLNEKEENELENKIKEIQNEINDLKETQNTLEKLKVSRKNAFEIEEKKEKQYLSLNREIDKLKTQIDFLEKELNKKKDIDIVKIQKNKIIFEEKLASAIEQNKLHKKDYETNLKMRSNFGEEISVLEYKLKEIEKDNKEINSLKGKCPSCKREMDEKHKNELILHNNNAKKELELKLSTTLKQTEKVIENIEKNEIETNKIEKIIEELRKEIYALQMQEKEAKTIEEQRKMLAEKNNSLPKIEKDLLTLNFNAKKLENTRKEFLQTRGEEEIIIEKLKSRVEVKKSHEETLAKIIQIKKSIFELEKEASKSNTISTNLGIFENCLISTQIELREALLETINEAMSTIWQQIYPYKDFLDAKLEVIENGYDLQVKTRSGEWIRVEGILSGGERSAAALCIRIAFSLVLTKQLSMLILDEPTHNLDANAVAQLASMLREDLPKLVSQIFIITHDKQLECASSSKLYLMKRNKDEDEATRIEEIETM